ncbi:Mbov_0283/Mbov_0339 family surface lipoprotein [Mycoplasmopsis bovis]|uniref:Mbov_0283/Mbov_0339 family surface lipoprotein n=1 Tax=Mycoplasmopsis bovis TaxID=28903 RepID=UPI001CF3B4A1|nr:hypothetical protein [Mycoplasmopsis bovis]MCA8839174.1 hypothetical protein [Mycoplasmopsis bovis]
MKRKLMLIGGGGLIFASSFPMIATSCGLKKKDVETSNSGNQDSKPNPESNAGNQDSRTNSESNSGNQDSKPNPESNAGNQDSRTNSESNSGNQDSKPNPESNAGNQDSETNVSSNELTRPGEKTQNDMPTEKYGINDYLDKVKEYGKEASELTTLLEGRKEGAEKVNELQKKPGLWEIVEKLSSLYESLKYDPKAIKEEIEEAFKNPRVKKELLDNLKQYKGSSEEIKTAIKELKGLKKNK